MVPGLINLNNPLLTGALNSALPYLQGQSVLSNDLRQRLLVSISSFFTVLLSLYYAYLEFETDDALSAMIQLSVAAAAAICFLISRSSYYRPIVPRTLLAIVLISMFAHILFDRGPLTLFYLFVIPLTTFFLFGLREGLIWTTATFILAVSILQMTVLFNVPSLSGATIDFVVVYLDLVFFSAGFEALRLRVHDQAEKRNQELLEEHAHLTRTQQDLAASEQRFRTFSELASDWLFEMDEKLTYTFATPRLFEILGGNIQGKNIRDLAIELEGDGNAFQPMLERKEIINQEVSFKNYEGERVVALFSAKPKFDEAGKFVGYIGAGKDITKIQHAQEELRLKDQSLHHIQKIEALGQLTSGVAHDFNNLLTVIGGNLELLDKDDLPEPEHLRIDSARRAVSRAASLTNQLLSFSRKQDLKPRAVDVSGLIGRLADMCSRTMAGTISIRQEVASNLSDCLADEGQLESALLNLAINARDAMSGQGELTFRANNYCHDLRSSQNIATSKLNLSPGDYLCISVIDDGVGIDPLLAAKIMEPFFTTKPSGEGTGLGLSMVFGFADQSGGCLEVQSEPGKGATFNLYLPTATKLTNTLPHPESVEMTSGDQRHVVLVEDDQNVREVLESNLTLLGFIVTTFNNGESALEGLLTMQPDLVVTDLMLGRGINGVELANQLNQTYPSLPTLLISGNADHLMTDEDMATHAHTLLRKPFSAHQLQGAIEGLLSL